MSIAYFPELYPDELIYSVLARFYEHSGYIYYKDVAQELFLNQKIRADKEFAKNLKPEIVELLTRNMTVEALLESHTMYPYYGRFIDSSRRNAAYEALRVMRGDFSKLFGIPQLKKGEHRFFKYCPLCAQEDRKAFGETYWHRIHQMRNIDICPAHGCYLINSNISLDSKVSVNLIAAEGVVPLKAETLLCKKSLELRIAKYAADVFLQPVNRESMASISDFLHHKLAGTPYVSARGEHHYFHKLWEDLQKYYKGITGIEKISEGQIQRLLYGKRSVFYEICLVAMFLNIGIEEITKMEIPLKLPEQIFDEKVKLLLASGIGINEAAREMGVGSSMIRMSVDISEKSHKVRKYNTNSAGAEKNWGKLDNQTLPYVQRVISELHGNGTERPRKISFYAVSKRLGISSHRLLKMKQCKKEIEKQMESIEQYHARKIMWGVHMLNREEKPILLWRICSLTKLGKEDMIASLPSLEQIAPKEIVDMVKEAISMK